MLSIIYLIIGALSIAYYLLIGFWARFNQSLSFIWIVIGAAFIIAGFVCRFANVPAWLKWAWRICVITAFAVIVALVCVISGGMRAKLDPGLDYIIVLGAHVDPEGNPSRALRTRTEAAAEYLKENPETKVIASGGQGSDEPISEAQCIYDGLVSRRIEPDRIIIEDKSTDTRENLLNSAEFTGFGARVGIITSNYHVYRALRLAKRLGFAHVSAGAAEYVGPTLPHYMVREACALLAGFVFSD